MMPSNLNPRAALPAFKAPAVTARAAMPAPVVKAVSAASRLPTSTAVVAAPVIPSRLPTSSAALLNPAAAGRSAAPTGQTVWTPAGPITIPPPPPAAGLSPAQAAALIVAQQPVNPIAVAATPDFTTAPQGGSTAAPPFTPPPVLPTAPAAAQAAAAVQSSGSSGSGGGGGGSSDPGPAQTPFDPGPAPQAIASNDPAAQAAAALVSPSTALAVTTPAPLATPAASLSLWARFWAWLGFGSKTATTPTAAVHGELDDAIGSLVRRARAGDQNAMGIIAVMGKNAKAGNVRAKASADAMHAYITAHPVKDATMSAEPNDATFCEAIKIARGPTLFDNRIARFAHGEFGADGVERAAFAHGVRNPHTAYPLKLAPPVERAHRMGRTVGLARKLQAVRMHGSPLSHYDAQVGHELGD